MAWILLSDSLLRILLPGRGGELVGSVKGIGFVVVTAIAMWAVLAARDRLLARAERERAAAIEATTAIFASSPLAIIAIDPRGCVTAWSPAAERVLGWPADRVVGRPAAILRPDDPAWIGLTVARVMAGETLFGIPLDYVHSDVGRRDLELFAAPLRSEDGHVRGAVVVAQDVTEARAAQAERNLLTAGLRAEIEDRQAVRAAIASFVAGHDADTTAAALVQALGSLDGLDYPLVFHLPADGGPVVLLAGDLPRRPAPGGELDEALSTYLRRRASEGPWTHLLATEPAPGAAAESIVAEAGLTGGIFVPLRHDDRVAGVVGCLTAHPDPGVTLGRRMTALIEVAAHAAPLLGPQLATRDDLEGRRARLATTIAERHFRPVFQPLVGLEDRAPVGYEALTRFDDLVAPAARFAEAAAIGVGLELESACLAAAVEAARSLPPGSWLAVNASVEMVLSGRLGDVLRGAGRPVVVELTEREAVADYAALRSSMTALGPGVSLAVDDTGAGFSGLRHVVELRPEVVKLDEAIVRAIDGDPVRQSLVAGMVHYARTTGTRLVAEGVETEAEAAALGRLGVEIGQGYLFGRPAPLEEIPADGRAA